MVAAHLAGPGWRPAAELGAAPRSPASSNDGASDAAASFCAKGSALMDAPVYQTDAFRMNCFKVLSCTKRTYHDWKACPFVHPGEHSRRRPLSMFNYEAAMCPAARRGEACPLGDACSKSHNTFEMWLHPSKYRTQYCAEGTLCKRKICFFAHTEAQLRRTRASPAGSETSGDSTATAPAPAGLAGPAGRAVAFVPLSAAAAAQLRAARTAAAAAAPALAPAPAGALLRPWLAGAPADAAAAAGVPAAPMPARLRGVVLGVSSGSPVVGSSAAQYTVLVPATAAPPATQVLGHPQVLRAAQPREQLLGVDCVAVVPDSSMQAPAAALWAFTQQQQMLQQHQQQHQQQHKQQSDMLQALLHDAQAAATAAVRADAAARNAAGLVAEFATAAGLPVLLPASAALQPPAAQGQLPSVRSAPAEGAGFAPLGPREFPARPSSATPTGGHAAAAPQYFSVSAAPGLQPAWGSGLGGSSSMSLDAWGSLAVSTEHAPMAATAALAAAPAAPASAPAALGQHLWAGGMPQFEQARPFPCF